MYHFGAAPRGRLSVISNSHLRFASRFVSVPFFHFARKIARSVRHQRTLLEELIAAGYNSDPLFPGSFTPLEELTPSTLPTELSDLSEPTESPRPVTVEPRSEEEVELLVTQTTAPATRSRTRALQAQAISSQNAASPSQPTASGSNQQPTTSGVPTPNLADSTTAPPQAPESPDLAAPQNQGPLGLNQPLPQIQAPAPPAPPAPPVQIPVVPVAPVVQPVVQVPAPVIPVQPNPAPAPVPANPNAGMPLANMPGRSERAAPSFDDSQPEELERYFADLELLLDRFGVTDNQDRKQGSLRYLKIRTESLWKTTEAWIDQTKSYDEFKAEVAKLYPGSSSDRTYTMQDLDMVIGQYARIGIQSSVDLGEYYRRFILISRYLISKNRLSTQEQSRTFFRGLQPQLEAKVRQRLQQKLIDHFPDDPYPITDIYDAVSYVLMGTASAMMTQGSGPSSFPIPTPAPTQPQASPAADQSSVKLEAMATAITSLTEMFKNVLLTQQAGAAKPRNTGVATAGTNAAGSGVCNFCGVPGHFIRECEVVEEAIRFGKCKRSPEGKVVLPTGAHVPRSITGAWLRDRVDEWHRQNPGQMAAQMYFEVTAAPPVSAPSYATAGHSLVGCPEPSVASRPGPGQMPAGVYALKRPFPPRPEVVITTLPPHKRGRAGPGNNPRVAAGKDLPAGPSTSRAPGEDNIPPPSQDQASAPAPAPTPAPELTHEPTHPYASVPDATHGIRAGPARPVAREPGPGRHEPGYRNTANIYDPRVAQVVYERAMETPITVTQRELLSLAPEMRIQVADATNRRRVPREQVVQAMVEEVEDEDEHDPAAEQTYLAPELQAIIEEVEDIDRPDQIVRESARLSHMPAAFAAAARVPPPNATIIADPLETYLREHPGDSNAADSKIVVAAESRALRAILPVVDGQDKVEAILDPGCQVVAMSEEICNALALHYDPTIRLHMMSANGGVDQSLGLARNVPFLVGDITLYLQIHVLRAPAYDILLGWPFDVLTQSVVRNYANENQTVTIKDPNTGRKATVPTIPRGSFRFADRRPKKSPEQQDF